MVRIESRTSRGEIISGAESAKVIDGLVFFIRGSALLSAGNLVRVTDHEWQGRTTDRRDNEAIG